MWGFRGAVGLWGDGFGFVVDACDESGEGAEEGFWVLRLGCCWGRVVVFVVLAWILRGLTFSGLLLL